MLIQSTPKRARKQLRRSCDERRGYVFFLIGAGAEELGGSTDGKATQKAFPDESAA